MKAPFPWFGGKSRVADLVWAAFGNVTNYVEPFAGSLAVLLARPHEPKIETVNDADCYLSNFWRATRYAPREVAKWADWPVSEIDLHARHRWLVAQADFREKMRTDPEFFDPRVAGWWVWGISQWIGGGWCAESNWAESVQRARGQNTATESRRPGLSASNGIHRRTRDMSKSATWLKRPSLGKGQRGIQRTADHEQLPMLSGSRGAAGRGVHASGRHAPIYEWMDELSARLRRVRICCGDWSRVLGRSATELVGVTGILLDPPYLADFRDPSLYGTESAEVSIEVAKWAIANGNNRKLKIALCGYEGEHDMPKDWQCVAWKAAGGYAAAAGHGENSKLERIWFSPHCAAARAQRILDL